MKIRNSIERIIAKSEEKKVFGTIRQDTVRKAIEANEFTALFCNFSYTDDYAYDNANNFGEGQVSAQTLLKTYRVLRPSCWVRGIKKIKGQDNYEITIQFHSNLSYSMYVPVA